MSITNLFANKSAHAETQRGSTLGLRLWRLTGAGLLNLMAYILIAAFLFPMSYMLSTSLKFDNQFLDLRAPLLPGVSETYSYQGKTLDVYQVPTAQGAQSTRKLALFKKGRSESTFIDPANPSAAPIVWKGQWRSLPLAYDLYANWTIFPKIWTEGNYPMLIRNTLTLAFFSEIGVLLSSILVAYGFSRFPIPGGKWLFLLLIGTIMIPEKVTLIPLYVLYIRLGWLGSYLPMLAPQLFGSAIFIFLLRQNFRSIPKDLDEAAMLDGAGPLRILVSVILPQSYPAVITVVLLQFFYVWNETRLANLILGTKHDLWTITYGIQNNVSFFPTPNLLQASALLVMIVPVVVLFLSQRVFMQHIQITGTEK